MDAPAPSNRPQQFVVAVLAAAGLCLLAYRGYGPQFQTRPTDRIAAPAVPVPAEPLTPGPSTPAAQPLFTDHGVEKLERKVVSPGLVNVNTADEAELQQLPSIGPVLAKRILEARAVQKFERIEDLRRVQGIGVKTVDKLRGLVRFS